MVRLLGLVIFNWLLLSQGNAAETTTIAAFGDSLFAGYGLPLEDSFPSQLEAKLNSQGYHVKIINDGISGDTTAGGVSRVEQVIAQKPDLVLLELGGNDLLRSVPPGETRKNLDTILTRLKRANIAVLLIGQKAPMTLGPNFASAYNAVFPELASIYSISLYPFFLDGVYNNPELMQQDGVHPTKEGVDIMVKNVAPMVTVMLKQ